MLILLNSGLPESGWAVKLYWLYMFFNNLEEAQLKYSKGAYLIYQG